MKKCETEVKPETEDELRKRFIAEVLYEREELLTEAKAELKGGGL